MFWKNKFAKVHFRKNWKWWLIPLLTIILIPIIGISIYQIRLAKSRQIINFQEKFEIPATDVFPELDVIDYYPYIEYVNGELIISDQLIAAVISDLVGRLQISHGDLSFSYQKITNKKIAFYVTWISKEKQQISKNFSLELD